MRCIAQCGIIYQLTQKRQLVSSIFFPQPLLPIFPQPFHHKCLPVTSQTELQFSTAFLQCLPIASVLYELIIADYPQQVVSRDNLTGHCCPCPLNEPFVPIHPILHPNRLYNTLPHTHPTPPQILCLQRLTPQLYM